MTWRLVRRDALRSLLSWTGPVSVPARPYSLQRTLFEGGSFLAPRTKMGALPLPNGGGFCAQQHQRHEVVAMINASQIKEHMEVKGSDGKHVGTVLGVEGEQVKVASGGMDHFIDLGTVDAVEGEKVRLKTSC
jgi:hypothetical protein